MPGRKGGLLGSLIKLPAFLWSVFFLYWSFPVGALCGRIRVLKLKGRRKDNFEWADLLRSFFRIDLRALSTNSLYTDTPCIYLCNHRCWADFFIDLYITQGRAQMMSRWMVFWVLPVFMMSGIAIRAALLFRRRHIGDKQRFNNWVDSKLRESPSESLLVYPEGHRSIAAKSLPLKRGMLHYAYSRRMPVQIIITQGKEQVLCEKTNDVRFGQVLKVGFSRVLQTSEFADFESFFQTLQQLWDETWREVEQSDVASLQPYQPYPDGFVYPSTVVLRQLGAIIAGVACMAVTARVTYGVVVVLTGVLGPWSKAVAAGLMVLSLASFWNAGLLSSRNSSSKLD